MSILDLIKDLKLPGEIYTLQHETYPDDATEDALGNLNKEWVSVQELEGTIQKEDIEPFSKDGQLEGMAYIGYFEPDFEIPYDKMGEYRIEHTFPSTPPFIRYFILRSIERNLKMDNKYHHYEIDLELSRKWG